jgi:phospholipase D1/2
VSFGLKVDLANSSSELYLRRPGKESYRLDKLLKRKAQEGVMIYVIL